MIKFNNLNQEMPYQLLKEKYDEAIDAGQKGIEAISIFSNYDSSKASAFNSFNQIAALLYWSNINVQIRMKAQIKKTSKEFNQKYFFDRSEDKNALAISSNQSKLIESYSQVKENYIRSLKNDDLKKCPEYWGGYSFTPYYFEFWEGHGSRINKREIFEKIDDVWKNSFLQP